MGLSLFVFSFVVLWCWLLLSLSLLFCVFIYCLRIVVVLLCSLCACVEFVCRGFFLYPALSFCIPLLRAHILNTYRKT